MFEVTVQDTFSSGHYLRNYKGKCENPHGHNYRVHVTLQGAELDHAGLLLDFKELKLVMKPVVDYLDHQMINDIGPSPSSIRQRKASPNISMTSAIRASRRPPQAGSSVKQVTIWETDTSVASYYE